MNSSAPLVSILVPAYNVSRYLPELCRSIQSQTYPNYEVIIGNDGSSDNPASVMAPFLLDPRFRLLEWQPNRGLHVAWAILLANMKGEYWCSPGGDDVSYPAFLEKRVEVMESNPQACLIHGPPELIDESGRPPQQGPALLQFLPQLCPPRSLEVLLQHNVINQPSTLIRASVTRQVMPFWHWDWSFAPDWFLWILHAATGFDLLWDAQVLIKYRVHSTALSWAPEKDRVRRAEVRLVPVLALRTAAQFSQWAATSWGRWGRTLYWRWLRQAIALQAKRGLKPEWLQLGAHAYYGAKGKEVSIWCELAKHGAGLVAADLRHRRAQQRQRFIVSGLAQIEDPIFRSSI